MKIGIIEDNIEVQKQLESLIQNWGKDATISFIGNSVKEAVELFSLKDIDLAVLDINI